MQIFEEYMNILIGLPYLFFTTLLYAYIKDKSSIGKVFIRGSILLSISITAANIVLFHLIRDYRSFLGYIVMMMLAMIYSNIFVPIVLGKEYEALYNKEDGKPKWDYMITVWVMFSVLYLLIVLLPI